MTNTPPLLGIAEDTPITPLLGAHMPTAGGHHVGLTGGKAIGCRSVQIFTASPRQWRSPAISDETRQAFQTALNESGISKTVAHDSYLINLAAPPGSDVLAKSRAAFRGEIERAEALNLDFLVSHPGAHGGEGEDVGIARLIESLDVIHAETAGANVRVAIETTAGQGTYLGGRFEQIARILNGVRDPERLVVCLDTCHVFAAGYDIRTLAAYDETLRLFDEIVGLPQLQVVHANDSQGALGSHKDRHAHIGEGEIGLEAFRLLVNDPRMAGLPVLIETPDGETMHEVNLARLRDLVGKESNPMTVMLELKPETEALAKAQAAAQGVPMEDYLNVILEEDLTARRNAEVRRRNIERNQAAIALLDKFLNTDEYGTQEEQRETLAFLRQAIDEDRPGQRSVFGNGFNPR